MWSVFFFFNDTATTEIYTLSLHDALPIYRNAGRAHALVTVCQQGVDRPGHLGPALLDDLRPGQPRSEEHTSELQSRQYLVCRLLLEKKKNKKPDISYISATHYLKHTNRLY